MQLTSIKTNKISYGDDICEILDRYIKTSLSERMVVAITSKILSIIQGDVVPKGLVDKYDLIRQEADLFLETEYNPYNLYLTVKDGILIPSAGIDESNAGDYYILYPKNLQDMVNKIWHHIRTEYGLQHVGVLVTDSHTTIMRKGVTGISLAYCGFEPLHSYVGQPDLFGRPLAVTQVNIVDALAVSAVFMMGEGHEATPIVLIKDAPHMRFLESVPSGEQLQSISIPLDEDLYAPLLRNGRWHNKREM